MHTGTTESENQPSNPTDKTYQTHLRSLAVLRPLPVVWKPNLLVWVASPLFPMTTTEQRISSVAG